MVKLTTLATASMLTLLASGALAQQVTLRVLDTFTVTSDQMDALIAKFEEANPDIDVQRDVQAVDDMRPTIQTALNSGTGPDVLYYDTGPGFAASSPKGDSCARSTISMRAARLTTSIPGRASE